MLELSESFSSCHERSRSHEYSEVFS